MNRWLVACLIVLPLALVIGREELADTALLTHVPVLWIGPCYAVGALMAILLYRNWRKTKHAAAISSFKRVSTGLSLLVLGIATSAYLGRWAFELAAFAGTNGTVRLAEAKLMGTTGGARSKEGMEVMAVSGGRRVTLWISPALRNELVAIRPPLWRMGFAEAPFCVTLPIEAGRWDTLRAHVPTRSEVWTSGYHKCRSTH